jgi:hypothetical protein
MPVLIIRKTFTRPHFKRLPARLQTAATSFPEQLDRARHLLIFLRSKSLLKPAKPPIDSLHRHLCLFGDGVAGRSTLSDIELVTTFSDETNLSSMTTGSVVVVVGMMLVSNRSNRPERPLLIIFVVSGSLIYSTLRAARSQSSILQRCFFGGRNGEGSECDLDGVDEY